MARGQQCSVSRNTLADLRPIMWVKLLSAGASDPAMLMGRGLGSFVGRRCGAGARAVSGARRTFHCGLLVGYLCSNICL